jgi:hypothetical protein
MYGNHETPLYWLHPSRILWRPEKREVGSKDFSTTWIIASSTSPK